MKYSFHKILLIQTAFLGDVVLSTSIIEKLKACYPEAKLDVLVKKDNAQLLQGHPHIHALLLFDKTRKYTELFRLIKKIRANRYDLVVNLQRFASSGILTVFSGAKLTIGFRKNPFSFLFSQSFEHEISANAVGIHEINRNQKLITGLTDEQALRPKLYFSGPDLNEIEKYQSRPYLCIAPASVWFTKQFPQERWVEFIKMLPQDQQIYLLGGPGDVALLSKIRSEVPKHTITILAGQISILQSALLMKGAFLNLVNDSAPLHLASAVNAPVCAVFCSTVPAFGFGPLSDFKRIVEVDYNLECRPCSLHGYKACPLGHFKCAHDIPLVKMKAAFDEALALQKV